MSEERQEKHTARMHVQQKARQHLLICTHLATPLEQGNFGLALAILVDEFVEERGDNRSLLQSRLSAITGRGHGGMTASNAQGTMYAVK